MTDPTAGLEINVFSGLRKNLKGSYLIVRHNPTGKEMIVLYDTTQLPKPGTTYACALIGQPGWTHVERSDCTPLRRTREYRNEILRADKIPPV
jgi:hypothetical protein